MADVDIPITAGTGTNIRAFQKVSGDYDQYVREARGTGKATLANVPWLCTTTGLSAAIPADVTRVGLILTSAADGIVYVRFDSTIPVVPTAGVSGTYDYMLNPGDRWEVPIQFCQLAQSWISVMANGWMLAVAATCA